MPWVGRRAGIYVQTREPDVGNKKSLIVGVDTQRQVFEIDWIYVVMTTTLTGGQRNTALDVKDGNGAENLCLRWGQGMNVGPNKTVRIAFCRWTGDVSWSVQTSGDFMAAVLPLCRIVPGDVLTVFDRNDVDPLDTYDVVLRGTIAGLLR